MLETLIKGVALDLIAGVLRLQIHLLGENSLRHIGISSTYIDLASQRFPGLTSCLARFRRNHGPIHRRSIEQKSTKKYCSVWLKLCSWTRSLSQTFRASSEIRR